MRLGHPGSTKSHQRRRHQRCHRWMVDGWLDSNSNFLRPPVVNRWFSIYKTELSVFIAKSECVVCTNHRCCSFCRVFWEEIIAEIPWTQLFARWIPLWSSSSGGNWGPRIATWETLNKKPSPTLAQQRLSLDHPWVFWCPHGSARFPCDWSSQGNPMQARHLVQSVVGWYPKPFQTI